HQHQPRTHTFTPDSNETSLSRPSLFHSASCSFASLLILLPGGKARGAVEPPCGRRGARSPGMPGSGVPTWRLQSLSGGLDDEVALSVADPKVAAVDEDRTVRPRGDGRTTLVARLQGREVRVPVEVRGVAKAGSPRFLTDVLPLLTKAGCNQGACHGAAAGKNGFKLSLFGYDPQSDYAAITRWGGARRVTRG